MRVGTPLTSEGNPALHVRLDPLLATRPRAHALGRNVTENELAKVVLGEYVKQAAEEREGVPAMLRHLSHRSFYCSAGDTDCQEKIIQS